MRAYAQGAGSTPRFAPMRQEKRQAGWCTAAAVVDALDVACTTAVVLPLLLML